MLQSIRSKLILSYLVIALLTALLIFALIRLTSDTRLKSLVLEQQTAEIVSEVAAWYDEQQTWDGFTAYFQTLHPRAAPPPRQGSEPSSNQPSRQPPPRPNDRGGAFGVVDAGLRALIPTASYRVGEAVPEVSLERAVAVEIDGETVAYVVPTAVADVQLAAEEEVYLQRTNQVLLTAGAVGIAVALLMGLGLAKVLIRPIQDLTHASRAMADGHLQQRVPVRSEDELGELATAFNQMSHDLAEATRQRRQLSADIAHDLGTPLQVISGYIEAAQEGALDLTPKRIDTIAAELGHLRRLIGDLDLLSQTDTQTLSLHMETVDMTRFLRQIESSFAPLAVSNGVTLTMDLSSRLPAVCADHERLMQVMGNLLNNALRYTPAGGSIAVTAVAQTNNVLLQVVDSGSGICAEDLPHIFERFYRADQARSDAGKMGLGLAISKALIEAMGGEISAESTPSVGTTFSVSLKSS